MRIPIQHDSGPDRAVPVRVEGRIPAGTGEASRWSVGQSVRITAGPFAGLTGKVESPSLSRTKVRLLVNIFGRETPLEVSASDLEEFPSIS